MEAENSGSGNLCVVCRQFFNVFRLPKPKIRFEDWLKEWQGQRRHSQWTEEQHGKLQAAVQMLFEDDRASLLDREDDWPSYDADPVDIERFSCFSFEGTDDEFKDELEKIKLGIRPRRKYHIETFYGSDIYPESDGRDVEFDEWDEDLGAVGSEVPGMNELNLKYRRLLHRACLLIGHKGDEFKFQWHVRGKHVEFYQIRQWISDDDGCYRIDPNTEVEYDRCGLPAKYTERFRCIINLGKEYVFGTAEEFERGIRGESIPSTAARSLKDRWALGLSFLSFSPPTRAVH